MEDNKLKKYIFIITLFIFCIGFCCINCTPDNDLWARLIVGQHIVEKLSVPKFDFLSYTPTHPWYDHEWGASIFFYIALKYFGHSGLILLKGILVALTLFFCFKTVELRKPLSTVSYNILYFVCMFLAMQKSLGATVRCLLFTCLFFSIFLYILERARLGKQKSLIFLPILMLLWSNIHGGCLSGIGLLGIYIVGEYLNKKPILNYIYTLLASLGVLFINPYGWEYVKFLFMAGTMDRSLITEWQNSFCARFLYEYKQYKSYLFAMITIIITYFIKTKPNYEKIDKTKMLLLLAMTYLSITKIRHQSFFVLTVGTLYYDEFYYLFNNVVAKIKEIFNINNKEIIEIFVSMKEIVVYLLIIVMALPPILNTKKQITITTTEYPRYAIEFLRINNITGNLLINFDWGSYAAYKLYPHNLIYMDGRYEEVYPVKVFEDLKDFHLVKNDWYKIIRNYKTDVMILEKKYDVYTAILNHPDWSLIFENNLSGVFVPSNTKRAEYLYPIPLDAYYNNSLFNTDVKL